MAEQNSRKSRHAKISVYDDYKKAWNGLLTNDIMSEARDHFRSSNINEVMMYIAGKIMGKALDNRYSFDYGSTVQQPPTPEE